MKRPLLLAAVLAAAPLMAGTAKADPLQMFNIVTPAAGVVNFSGTGTANFNQSLGTSNNVNLNSNTVVGVNASASSTSDYTSSGFAQLDLDGSSRLQQTIGTATQAFNTNTAAEASARSAHTTAFERANSSKYGVEYTSSYDAEYQRESGWELNSNYDATLDNDATPQPSTQGSTTARLSTPQKPASQQNPSVLGKPVGRMNTIVLTPTPMRQRSTRRPRPQEKPRERA